MVYTTKYDNPEPFKPKIKLQRDKTEENTVPEQIRTDSDKAILFKIRNRDFYGSSYKELEGNDSKYQMGRISKR